MDTDAFKAAKGDAAAEEEAGELKTTCHCNIAVGNPKPTTNYRSPYNYYYRSLYLPAPSL
jgi:hypothetical protein